MNKAEIIIDLLKSLNQGNSCDTCRRTEYAIMQYSQLVKEGIINEDGEDNERSN